MEILYEDKDVLVLNKPAGIAVHKGVGTGHTVADWLVGKYPKIEDVGDSERPGIVHRLDKMTSGVMVVAKTQSAFDDLHEQFKAREVKKEYLALVHGRVERDHGEITLPVGRSPKVRIKRTVGMVPGARSAITMYVVEKHFRDHSLVRVRPFTGRTHQIRVHLAAINHPIVGDKLYMTKPYRKLAQPDNLFLHAQRLGVRLPIGTKTVFEAPLPHWFQDFLKTLD